MPDQSVSGVEVQVAHAHRAIRRAVELASEWSDLGAHDDLQLFLLELERFQVDLLRGRSRFTKSRRHRAYLSSSRQDDGRTSA